ncbi:hypothetical protein D7X96_14605 [Corallococcus interemptor]|uniref:GON domain-containing protein n=1 Tax=Corallococcus interemptor TaxID=2316720 RepID=A0A3A8QXF2_9BACT|nr:GON domain-containing protein [Corallococcus interemptor]RKH69522.1 hypothetical protein D7X96_14605 [Corallococcus interemptor]
MKPTPKSFAVSTSHQRATRALAWSLTALAVGCGANDSESPPKASASQALTPLPATCADVHAAHPNAPDGNYGLYVGNDPDAYWTAYCHDMAGTPREYLTLPFQMEDTNVSRYLAGGASPGTSVITRYTRVRLHPDTFQVDTGDQTFATSTGELTHSPDTVRAVPFGVAMSCDGEQAQANINLVGTSFEVDSSLFGVGGFDASGTAVSSDGGQAVTLSGGGFCGWTGPLGSYNPYNQTGSLLQLKYRPPVRLPATCKDLQTDYSLTHDGEYTLCVGRDPNQCWTAWCHGMDGAAPREYLTLQHTEEGANFSQYLAGSPSPGTTVRTRYTRVRVLPATLQVDTGDQTFATSTGQLTHSPHTVTAMTYGAAMSCNGIQTQANVDLRGTRFSVQPSRFGVGGYRAGGSVTPSASNQVFSLSGGGSCGWAGPQGSYNPYNQFGTLLQLTLNPPQP